MWHSYSGGIISDTTTYISVPGLFHKAIVQSGGVYSPWGYTGHNRGHMARYKQHQNLEQFTRDLVVEEMKQLHLVVLELMHLHVQYAYPSVSSVRYITMRLQADKKKLFDHIGKYFTILLFFYQQRHEIQIFLGPSAEKQLEGAFIPPDKTIDELIEQAEPVPLLAGITEKEGYMIYFGI